MQEATSVQEATAGTDFAGAPKEVREAKANYDRYERAVRQLEKHVEKGADGKFTLKAKKAKDADVDEDMFEEFKRSVDLGNEQLEHGVLSSSEIEAISADGTIRPRHSSGDNHIHFHWWGVQVYANESFTHELLTGAQKSGAAVAAVLALLGVSALVGAALGAIIFLAAGLYWMICAWGGHKGLVLNMTWAGSGFIWHQ